MIILTLTGDKYKKYADFMVKYKYNRELTD